jgi:hypothetical protein
LKTATPFPIRPHALPVFKTKNWLRWTSKDVLDDETKKEKAILKKDAKPKLAAHNNAESRRSRQRPHSRLLHLQDEAKDTIKTTTAATIQISMY